MSVINFFKSMFSYKGETSSKRFIGFISAISLIGYMFVNKSERAIEAVEYIAIATIIGTAAEKFKKDGNQEGSQTS